MEVEPKRIRPRRHSIGQPYPSKPVQGIRTTQYLTVHNGQKGRGYHVRIGRFASLFFGFTQYGSFDGAFDAAVKYRDEVLRLLNEAEFSYKGNMTLNRRNKTGIIGVALQGNEAYIAQWVDNNGVHRKRWFAINKYGKEESLRLAIAKRAEEVGEFPDHILRQIEVITTKVKNERNPGVIT